MKRLTPIRILLAGAATAALVAPAFAAEVIINNNDGPGVGMNDPSPATPIGGNPGTTLGEQRFNVLLRAAQIWADNLDSDVPIIVNASSQTFGGCAPGSTGAVLASAGAGSIFRNFPGAPLANTWYHGALANSIAGVDLDPGLGDITTQYNLDIDDDPDCLGGEGWYYGFDHDEETNGGVDLLAVMLHEYGHGLGFANFANESTGTLNSGFPDVYTTFTRDLETEMDWNDMTNAERQASSINDPDVVWTGPAVTNAVPQFLTPPPTLIINSPGAIAGTSPAQNASFGPLVPAPAGLTGDVVLADDGTGPNVNDGCEALTNGADISGNIALIDRGSCNFTVKVKNAQLVGAIGVLIANNNPDPELPPMGGSDPTITIPSYGILNSVGTSIKTELPGVNVTMGFGVGAPAGTASDGVTDFLRVNAPNPVQPGSSISHWTIDAFPSLLMEPSITPNLTDDVDLTLEHFVDIGWTLLGVFSDGFEAGNVSQWTSSNP